MTPDLLAYDGGAIKRLPDDPETGALRAAGYLVVFSGEDDPDLAGDYFTKSTDFGALSDGLPVTLPAYYDHGLDSTLKTERIGTATLKIDDVGVFADYTIARRKEYLARLLEEGHLGQSSGAVGHLVERAEGPAGKAWWLKTWPLGEASLTPTPAEPRTSAVPVKSLRAEVKAESLSARIDRVHRAWHAVDGRGWVAEVFDAYVVAEMGALFYQVPYTDDGSAVTFAPPPEWVRVERAVSYDPVAKALKSLADTVADDSLTRALRAIR